MKKYWKLLLMSGVIIFAISAHYIQSARALEAERVMLTMETIAGDASELDDVTLQASYNGNYMSQWVYISKDSVRDVHNRYGVEQFSTYKPLLFERYLEDYRSFMRGKQYDLSRYNEDEERLIYVETSDLGRAIYKGEPITLKVDVLQKEAKKRTKFEATALAKSHYSWLDVVDVYAANGEVKVLVSGSFDDGGADLQLYTINEESQQVTASEVLGEVERQEEVSTNIYYDGDPQMVGNAQHYVYRKSTWRYDDMTGQEKTLSNDYYVYTLATNTIDELHLPEKRDMYHSFQQGNHFYTVAHDGKSLTLYAYDLVKQRWVEPFTVELVIDTKRTLPYVKVNEGKLYVANQIDQLSELSIYQLETADLLYKGQLTAEQTGPYTEVVVEQIFY